MVFTVGDHAGYYGIFVATFSGSPYSRNPGSVIRYDYRRCNVSVAIYRSYDYIVELRIAGMRSIHFGSVAVHSHKILAVAGYR